ncbi:Imm42 family immunity protein [Mesorhizobium sp. GbtcB19]|uniref:Imm42 family immunity protein n=1 Tax=Mesorhizobium sp. GbtcB19 TaxID=2824764 RepID=UPI001C2F2116|nr:Imm42 family immunity protein [Mesorhizobium sp. GbtcB19]
MIVGDPSSFAIESGITQAFANPGQFALGYFIIHIRAKMHGVKEPDASLLACSVDAVSDRLRRRGTHQAANLSAFDATEIAQAYLDAFYRETARADYFGLSHGEFSQALRRNSIVWAPDGDEAFDDGSHVLQFDVGSGVRLIGLVDTGSESDLAASIVEERVDADVFYDTLSRWSSLFAAERAALLRSQR